MLSAALNSGGYAELTSVSCGTPGNCTAGGYYLAGATSYQAFVVSEVNGTWHHAVKVPGIAALNRGGHAVITSVSCGSAGNCSALGSYTDSANDCQAFVVSKAGAAVRHDLAVPGSRRAHHPPYGPRLTPPLSAGVIDAKTPASSPGAPRAPVTSTGSDRCYLGFVGRPAG